MRKVLLAVLLALSAFAAPAPPKVALLTGELAPPAQHGLDKLRTALLTAGIQVIPTDDHADYVIRLAQSPTLGPEALTIQRATYQGKPAVTLTGGDAVGLMYAALDTAERISWSTTNPFQYIREVSEQPYIADRGISMYSMQRAYFESRLYDARYWTLYFDMLAADRINNFIVIFGYENGGFMAPLYPYFFNVPEYPGVEFVGLTPQQQARNTASFKAMIRIAHERGIAVTAGIWDHIYRGGVQGGGIPGASENAGKRTPGLVWGVTADNLAGYTKAALKRFLEVFPEVDAIQFRMHDESGLKRDEIQPFWHDVFASIQQSHPKLRLDLRAKGLPDAVINDAVDLGLNAKISTKYWMEQMGLPFHPTHINVQDQRNRRHGYADLLRYPQNYRVHWQLWTGGTARLLLWGDPDYVRRFASSVRLYDGNSFEVNEMLATKMLGEPADEKPLDILKPAYRYYDYEFERYWHFYRVWGRLTYRPNANSDVWEHEFITRFGPQAAPHVMKGLHLASQVLPRIVAASYLYSNFPTTRGWAEMNRQGSLPQYANEQGSDIQQFMNVRDEAKSILQGTDTAMRRPEETSDWFTNTAANIDEEIMWAEKAIGRKWSPEFGSTITDLKILAGLARYHSIRLLGGVRYNLYKQTGDLDEFDTAISAERTALQAWDDIAAAAGDLYNSDLAFGAHAVGFSRHWKEEYTLLSRDFESLLAERQKASGKNAPTRRVLHAPSVPPVVRLQSAIVALPGKDLRVDARVHNPAGLKWARLRYRHVTQFEDYRASDMTMNAVTGLYTAFIPASFIDPKWDLMYFVEVVDKLGNGRMYPDMDVATPYVIVKVKR
jgi:hypothetical protein